MSRLAGRCLALLVLAAAAFASAPAPAAPPQIVSPTGNAIQLDVGKGRLVRLAKPAASVFIADPEIADVQVKSPMLVYLYGKAGGATTLYAVGAHDEVLLNAELSVHYDVARVEQAIHDLVPRSAVTVTAIDDSLVLGGTVYSAAAGDDIRKIAARFVPDAKHLINRMKVDEPNQINLRVRIAEVSRDIIKELGVNWQTLFNPSSHFTFGLLTALPSTFSTTSNLNFGYKSGPNRTADVNALIDALDSHGLITVLAEPNLTAVSGEPASFLAGGEFPVPVPQSSDGGGSTITIEWKKFGVSLNFVATIAASNRINLRVMPEVSQLSNAGAIVVNSIQVPSLTTRRAETTVELGSGQSFAIAGLLQNNVTQNIDKFPWLGDTPVLGPLFRSEAFRRNESELVIIVTPYIVHPIATARRAMVPTDGYVPPSDSELVLKGEEYKPQAPRSRAAALGRGGTALIGPVGFDLE